LLSDGLLQIISVAPSNLADAPARLIQFNYRSPLDNREDWAMILPPKGTDTWIVCIHGHGSHGDQLYTRKDINETWLPAFRKSGFGILTPNLRDNSWMAPAAVFDLHLVLNYLRTEYSAQRFIFASGSMGGTSNLIYAVLYPQDVDAVIGLGVVADLTSYYGWCRNRNSGIVKEIADAIETAYGGTPDQIPDVYERHSTLRHTNRLRMPIYIAHGTNDALMPICEPRNLAVKLTSLKTFHYEEIPHGGHDAPLGQMPQALDWILQGL
jgi:pimeloyl-ACP methyl ester carboxylesterase